MHVESKSESNSINNKPVSAKESSGWHTGEVMHARYCYGDYVCQSVRPSVCLSHCWSTSIWFSISKFFVNQTIEWFLWDEISQFKVYGFNWEWYKPGGTTVQALR